jgi:hypothetical protein
MIPNWRRRPHKASILGRKEGVRAPSPERGGGLPAGKILERAVLSDRERDQDNDEKTFDQFGQIHAFHEAPPGIFLGWFWGEVVDSAGLRKVISDGLK